jgi:DNA polymerase-3 subunit beta
MKCSFTREQLLSPLQAVIGAVEKKQTMPILSNILLRTVSGKLQLVGTDLEIELLADTDISVDGRGETTVPARKLLDICKNLPDGAEINLSSTADRVTLNSGRSRFVLAALPAADFPVLEDLQFKIRFSLAAGQLKAMIERTGFAMAQQDVRYYLNGLLLESRKGRLLAVATDGHRLAMTDVALAEGLPESKQVIVPRKGVMELQRLLAGGDEQVELAFSDNHVRAQLGRLRFTSKLIDGRFPDYERVMPADGDKELLVDRGSLRQSLTRTSILSNEKYRGVRLMLGKKLMKIQTQNPDKEEAEEELEIDYQGADIEIAFNVNYLLDVLGVVGADKVRIILKDANSSCMIHEDQTGSRYVIMPMRL